MAELGRRPRTAAMGIAAMGLLAAASARAADPAWLDPALQAAARQEGPAIVYASVNEEEELPQLQAFEKATGLKVDYIRGSDTALMSRIAIEARAGKQTWDVVEIQAAESIPAEWRMQVTPSEAVHLLPGAKDPDNRWFAGYTVFHAPAYNTTKVKPADLPATYEDFARHPEWAGHVAIDFSDRDWLAGLYKFYGDAKAKTLVQDIVATVHPALYKGHLALARALGSGEYWVTLNNFVNLTLNVKLSGAPVDYWILEPVVVSYGQIAVNARAPHSNAAKLLLNYLISAEAETMRTSWGRIPTRADVASNPPGIVQQFMAKQIVRAPLSPADDAKWQKTFNDLFRP